MKNKVIFRTISVSRMVIILSFVFALINTIPGRISQGLLDASLHIPLNISSPDDVIQYYDESGSFAVSQNTAFEGNYLYYPTDLGRNGTKHPLVVWGDGTGTSPWMYGGLLRHLASHGFVVIAPDVTDTGNGETMIAAMELIKSKNDDSESTFYQNLDVDKICVMGHSQGGSTTLLLGERDDVTCTIPLMPSYWLYIGNGGSMSSQKAPMLLLAGTEDTICSPGGNSDVIFADSNVPTYYGKLIGADHFEAVGDAGEMRKYITAWCYLHLFENIDAQSIFYGNDALIYDDSEWIWETNQPQGSPGSFSLSINSEIPYYDYDGNFDLIWTLSLGADTYTVYEHDSYFTEFDGSQTPLTTIIGTSFSISGRSNGTYYFLVYANNIYGHAISECVNVTVGILSIGPPEPFVLNINADTPDKDGNIRLYWTESLGANNYSIYIKYVENDVLMIIELHKGLTTKQQEITGLLNGTYSFQVTAFNNFGNYSTTWKEVVVNITEPTEPSISGYDLFLILGALGVISVVALINRKRRIWRVKKQ